MIARGLIGRITGTGMAVPEYGNTAAASVPICLHEALSEGRIKDGDLVMLVAFGTGFSWGATLLRW